MPTALSPIWEIATNKDWRGLPVLSESDKRVSPSMQYNRYTSELAKAVGGITGQSPKQIDHAIKGFTGTLGSMGLDTIDQVSGKKQGEGVWPIFRGFIADSERASVTVDQYYDYKKQLDTSYSDSKRKGELMPGEDMVGRKLFSKFDTMIEKLQKVQYALEDQGTPDSKLKANVVRMQIQDLMKQANKTYEKLKK